MYIRRMANFSFRFMTAFLFVALILNVSNYFFVRIYNAARSNSMKVASSVEVRKSLASKFWATATIMCDNENTPHLDNSRIHSCGQPEITTHSSYSMITEKIKPTVKMELVNCPELPPGLGPELRTTRSVVATNIHYIKGKLDDVKPGGIFQPAHCKSLQSVAIIIAYRGCRNYLTTFMNALHPFLIKQQLDYQIFVVEQSNKSQPYNRGKLLNVGFMEASRYRKDGFRCIIIHEPHVVPLDSRNLYRCSWFPRQLATIVERPKKAPYVPLLGGAIAVTPGQFLKFNGFSNTFWGNDADYYDLYSRINASGYVIESSFHLVGKYKTIKRGLALWDKSQLLSTPSPLYLLDGISSLSYTVDTFELRRFYTYLQVNIDAVITTETRTKLYEKLLNHKIEKQKQITKAKRNKNK